MEYLTRDLLLRPAVRDDWEPMYRNLWRHAESARWMFWEPSGSEEEARERIERTIRFEKEHPLCFLVIRRDGGEAIGFAGMLEKEPGVYEETGIALGPDFTGKGYGRQALAALLALAFEERRAERFLCSNRAENVPSRRLQEYFGFRWDHSEEREDPRNGAPFTMELRVMDREGYRLAAERVRALLDSERPGGARRVPPIRT